MLQVALQLPQLFGSVCTLMQTPPQLNWPFGQHWLLPDKLSPAGQPQTPLWQITPVPTHGSPQAPQLFTSVCVSMHTLPQTDCPGGHLQAAFWHVCPAGHRLPQLWQLFGSVSSSTHTPPQMMSPVGQAQTPAWHVCPLVHVLPQ
jgi:hypothetical protein